MAEISCKYDYAVCLEIEKSAFSFISSIVCEINVKNAGYAAVAMSLVLRD